MSPLKQKSESGRKQSLHEQLPYSVWDLFITKVKAHYQLKAQWLKRPIAEGKWKIGHSFVNLALILEVDKKTIGDDSEQKDLDWHDNQVNQAEKIYENKKAISYRELFQDSTKEAHQPLQKIFVMGAAGAGKTTLSQRIAYDWSQGQESTGVHLPASIQLVIWIKLRNLRAYLDLDDIDSDCSPEEKMAIKNRRLPRDKDRNLIELAVLMDYLCSKKYDLNIHSDSSGILKQLQLQQKNVLYLIDGYDEIASLGKKHPVKQVFEHLLKQSWVLVTSRPYHPISNDVEFRKVELLGFPQKDMLSYVDLHFKEKQPKPGYSALKNLLQGNNALRGLAHIPINLEILCAIMYGWKKKEEKKSLVLEHSNVTMLYQEMVFHFLKRGVEKKLLSDRFIAEGKLNDEEIFPDKEVFFEAAKKRKILPFLGALALERLKTRELQFSVSFIKKRLPKNLPSHDEKTFFNDVLNLGFIRGFKWNKEHTDFSGEGEFLHLTLQEFFAAWTIAEACVQVQPWFDFDLLYPPQLDKEALQDLINEYKYASSFGMVWPFVTGLLAQKKDKRPLETFVTLIESPPLELRGLFHEPLRVRCIEELLPHGVPENSEWANFVALIKTNFEQQSSNWSPPGPTLKVLKASPAWGCLLADVLCRKLEYKNLEETGTALNRIQKFGPILGTSNLLNQLILLLNADIHPDNKFEVCVALGWIGGMATEGTLANIANALMMALCDLEGGERVVVYSRLSWLGALATGETLFGILEFLRKALNDNDVDDEIRESACRALGHIGVVATGETLTSITKSLRKVLLGNNNEKVRLQACWSLEEIGVVVTGERLASIVKVLLRKVSDNNQVIKLFSCLALSRLASMVTRETLTDITEALVERALNNGDDDVRPIVCDVLGQIGTIVTGNTLENIIDALAKILNEDSKGKVRGRACKALSQIGIAAKAEDLKVISNILIEKALKDSDLAVRADACGALGNLASVVKIKKDKKLLTDKLTQVLKRDSSLSVRICACAALTQLGIFIKDEDLRLIVNELLEYLKDDNNLKTRSMACFSLGELSGVVKDDNLENIVHALINTVELKNNEPKIREAAYSALGKLGGAAKDEIFRLIVNALIQALSDNAPGCGAAVCTALSKMGKIKLPEKVLDSLLLAWENGRQTIYNSSAVINILDFHLIKPFNETTSVMTRYLHPGNGICFSLMLDFKSTGNQSFVWDFESRGNQYFIRPLDNQGNREKGFSFQVNLIKAEQILDAVEHVRKDEYLGKPSFNRALFGLPVSKKIEKEPNKNIILIPAEEKESSAHSEKLDTVEQDNISENLNKIEGEDNNLFNPADENIEEDPRVQITEKPEPQPILFLRPTLWSQHRVGIVGLSSLAVLGTGVALANTDALTEMCTFQ